MSFLEIHIAGGVLSSAVIAANLVLLSAGRGEPKLMTISLKAAGIFQSVTGLLLLAAVPGARTADVCLKGLAFIALIFATAAAVNRKYSPAHNKNG